MLLISIKRQSSNNFSVVGKPLATSGTPLGYLTNLIALKLIFEPIEPTRFGPFVLQGIFLKRQMVIKQDGSQMPFEPTDFQVGLDLGLCGRSIRIYDCDQYTREFFENLG